MSTSLNIGTLNVAVQAARKAGQVIYRFSKKLDRLKISDKGINEFVSEADLQAENAIIEIIQQHFPDHAILAEESGETQKPASADGKSYRWIIDPLDGTTNFLHNIPQYAVSIALEVDGKLQDGVIYNPVNEELFTASRGQGAFLNDRRIRVSQNKQLALSLIGTGFPFHANRIQMDTYVEMFKAVMAKTSGIRRPGAAALDLAYVACGRFEGFFEIGLKPWDIAAGALLIQEAGGMVTDLSGRDTYMQSGNILAGGIKIHAQLERLLSPYALGLKKS
ncbi:MAG: inositol monophosphatase [Gammaproteobacteria bacterium]|nr:inositol monophosphatase [Gammaproteobacteria bacterium]NNC96862.1 inositol monophosphatase [Gammaproteobacteria bacterium]NNM13525.1 inositol monophosphatase [Gammaproteobacteria bacterium]